MKSFTDVSKYERIYTDHDGSEEYQYRQRSTPEGLDLGNKYADTLEELQKLTGMSEGDITETLVASGLQRIF